MDTPINVSIALRKTVFDQAEKLAQQLEISLDQLFETAMEDFVRNRRTQPANTGQAGSARRLIQRGDIYWAQLEPAGELDSGVAHPYVVVQDDLFNHSRIPTLVACALTSNKQRVSDTPGNVLLDAGEGNLPKQSVVEVSKITTIPKSALGVYIGTLSAQRVNEILAGLRFLQSSFFTR